MNKPEKDRCLFRGGRGTLVLLLRFLSLALYSTSVPGHGVQVGGRSQRTDTVTHGEKEGADRTNVTRYNRDTEREKTRKNISWAPTHEPGVAWCPRELRPCLELLSHHLNHLAPATTTQTHMGNQWWLPTTHSLVLCDATNAITIPLGMAPCPSPSIMGQERMTPNGPLGDEGTRRTAGPAPLCGKALGTQALLCPISSPPSPAEMGMGALPRQAHRRCEVLLVAVPAHAGNL